MIESIPTVDDRLEYIPDKARASNSKVRILGISVSLSAIMLFVSIQGWIINDVVDGIQEDLGNYESCLLYTSPSPRD